MCCVSAAPASAVLTRGLCVDAPAFIHPLTGGRAFGICPLWGCDKQGCRKHQCTGFSVWARLFSGPVYSSCRLGRRVASFSRQGRGVLEKPRASGVAQAACSARSQHCKLTPPAALLCIPLLAGGAEAPAISHAGLLHLQDPVREGALWPSRCRE